MRIFIFMAFLLSLCAPIVNAQEETLNAETNYKLQNSLQDLQSSLNEMIRNNEDLSTRNYALVGKIKLLEEELRILNDEQERLLQATGDLARSERTERDAALSTELDQLKSEQLAQEEFRKKLKADADTSQSEQIELERNIKSVEGEILQLQSHLQKIRMDSEQSLKYEKQKLISSISVVQEKLRARQTELEKLKMPSSVFEKKATLEQEQNTLISSVEILKLEIEGLVNEEKRLKEEVKYFELQKEKDLAKVENDLKILRFKLEKMERVMPFVQEKIGSHNSPLPQEISEEQQQLEQNILIFEQENQTLKDEIIKLKG